MSFFTALMRGFRLMKDKFFLPGPAFRLGLFNPEILPQALSRYVSPKQFNRLQSSLNPESF